MMFLFDWLIFRCPLVCSGVPFLKLTVHPRDLYWKPPSSGTMLVSGQFCLVVSNIRDFHPETLGFHDPI